MNDPVESSIQEPLPVVPVMTAVPVAQDGPRWGWVTTALAWLVILGLAGLMAVLVRRQEQLRAESGEDSLGLLHSREVGRFLVGSKAVVAAAGTKQPPADAEQVKTLNTGTVEQRLRYLVTVGELLGPAKVLEEIDALQLRMKAQGVEPTKKQTQLLDILKRLYGDYANLRLDAPSVTAQERELLRTELDWFGDLALAPEGSAPAVRQPAAAVAGGPAALAVGQAQTPDPALRARVLEPATRTVIALLVMYGLIFVAGAAGLVLLIVVGILWLRGKVRGGLHLGTQRGGIYAETFALWMAVFLGIMWVLSQLVRDEGWREAIGLVAPLLSLGVLVWPVVRGVPWRYVLHDVGLTPGRQPLLEPGYGIVCYVMMLPLLGLLALGLGLVLWLVRTLQGGGSPEDFFGPTGGVSHPAVELLIRGSFGQRLVLALEGTIIAAVVEETMFRGVLYRHLRELTARWNAVLSVLLSGLGMGFVFAVVHPQGLMGVPFLMALSFAFTLAREWRGTLIPGMVTHALNNGAIFLLVVTAMAD
jgi:membrane protease YdiL (CAAX protease family)